MVSSLQMYSRCERVSLTRQGVRATNLVDGLVRRLPQQQRVFPFPDNHGDCRVLYVLVRVALDKLDVDEGLDLAAPGFLAIHARAFLGVILRLERVS